MKRFMKDCKRATSIIGVLRRMLRETVPADRIEVVQYILQGALERGC